MSHPATRCAHHDLQVTVSSYAAQVGFKRPTPWQRLAATTLDGKVPGTGEKPNHDGHSPYTFPAPLILPGDDLAENKQEWQPVHEWNALISQPQYAPSFKKKTIYVVAPPTIRDEVAVMRQWSTAQTPKGKPLPVTQPASISIEHIKDYLAAFYHGFEVKLLPEPFFFTTWETARKPRAAKQQQLSYVALGFGDIATRVRARPRKRAPYSHQLQVGDLLDALISAFETLDDAFAITMLVDQDIYEDDEDEFIAGRAYGGSHVSMVSTARYHPAVDDIVYGKEEDGRWERAHEWPLAHCRTFVEEMVRLENEAQEDSEPPAKKVKLSKNKKTQTAGVSLATSRDSNHADTPLGAAIEAAMPQLLGPKSTPSDRYGLWLSRVARTVAHELGHCCGMDHCVYYACMMQGSGTAREDLRQPPYLCPVCLKKLFLLAKKVDNSVQEDEFVRGHYSGLKQYCASWKNASIFAGLEAWIKGRQKEIAAGTGDD
jgi:archaemetzincin